MPLTHTDILKNHLSQVDAQIKHSKDALRRYAVLEQMQRKTLAHYEVLREELVTALGLDKSTNP